MIEFEFLINNKQDIHMHANIELFYVMEGNVHFFLEDKEILLEREDFLIVNADKKHSFYADKNLLVACMYIDYAKLSKLLKQNMILFLCNSTMNDNEMFEIVRGIIKKIVSEQFHNKAQDEIYMNSLYYELLHVLTHDFLMNREDKRYTTELHKFDDRKHEIDEYIRLNFDKQISLKELAEKLYLSGAYLSKYIKKQFGMSFVDYVNSVRLNYAVSQLLYSDKSIVRIAMDTGFASSAALNKVFKEKYNITPTVYRSQWKNVDKKSHNTVENEGRIRKQVERYFESNKEEKQLDGKFFEEAIIVNKNDYHVLEKPWCKMINIGTAADLLHSDVQQHVIILKKQLSFSYVRFWDIYSQELFLKNDDHDGEYNFDKLDRVLDFLVENNLWPYIEVGMKPKKVIQNRKKMLINKKGELSYWSSEATLKQFASALITHLINRYGSEEVEKWYFELWKPENEEDSLKDVVQDETEAIESYLCKFDLVAGTFREYLSTIKIGGAGLTLRYGEDNFRTMLRKWKEHQTIPDFLSVYCYPYTIGSIKKEKNQTIDREFLKNNLIKIRSIMAEEEFPVKDLHVSEWSFTISNRNVLNDNCLKGAYLVKNMIDSIDLTDILGYWTGSDLFADYYDSKQLLNGSNGLLSKGGICKPSYYAFEFMSHLGRYFRKKGDHYLISDNGNFNWRIVCHNLKNLNYQYGLTQEDKISVYEQNNLMTDQKKVELHFKLPAHYQGTYQIRIYSINHRNGSLQDEWIAMSNPKELNLEDINYLKRISIPRMIIHTVEAVRDVISFDTILDANEIQFIHTTYKYK